MYAELRFSVTLLLQGKYTSCNHKDLSRLTKNVDCPGAYTYIVSVDAQISDEAARKTDELPILLHHKVVGVEHLLAGSTHRINKRAERKLIDSHLSRTEYLISLEFPQVLQARDGSGQGWKHDPCFTNFIF